MEARKKEKEIILFISLILISLALMGLDKLNWLNWLKGPIEKLSNPVKERVYKTEQKKSINNQQLTTNNNKTIEIENADLKVKLRVLEQENTAMKKLLGAPLSPAWQFIPVQALSVKNGIMTINQGSDVGINQGQIVVFENVLVGRIIKVNPQLSKIELIIHKDTNIKAKVIETNARGQVKLEAGNVLVLDGILQEFNLVENQIIATSGEDEIFPPNLLIAKIDSIEKNEAAIYQKAILKPFFNYQTLERVFIIKDLFYP